MSKPTKIFQVDYYSTTYERWKSATFDSYQLAVVFWDEKKERHGQGCKLTMTVTTKIQLI